MSSSIQAPTVDADPERRKRTRRLAIVLGLIALAFYLGFILLGVSRA
ncbi:MAG TPA: hypothetical protein VJ764_04720 [Steroidobacteraceae bacterium]|nr:hypothetical protein [Steroidobacteraceae bacterium]